MTSPPIMGAAIRFMTSAPVPVLQSTGTRPMIHRGDGHELRAEPLRRALDDALAKLGERTQLVPSAATPVVRQRQIEQHHDARLRVQAGERDDADPDRDADVVVEEIEKPDRADERERHRQHHDERFDERLRVEVEERKRCRA